MERGCSNPLMALTITVCATEHLTRSTRQRKGLIIVATASGKTPCLTEACRKSQSRVLHNLPAHRTRHRTCTARYRTGPKPLSARNDARKADHDTSSGVISISGHVRFLAGLISKNLVHRSSKNVLSHDLEQTVPRRLVTRLPTLVRSRTN